MTWTLTEDLGEYLDAAGDFLRSRAAENTVLLNAAEIVRIRGPTWPTPPATPSTSGSAFSR